MAVLCRDCLAVDRDGRADGRCPDCGSPRRVAHAELLALGIAHLDCDAFYASIEKRDEPALRDRPVIVGGGRRGVVSAACYIARTFGVHSAMPMFKARKACPDAVVIRPDMRKYATVGGQIRALMRDYTPLVEPLALDEAFLDLSGTERLHGRPPAATAALLVRRIEDEIGVTASIGLSYNKFLAKIASDLNKPRGFAVIGRAEAVEFLSAQPVGIIWGAGKALQKRLAKDGITTVAQLRAIDEGQLIARYGAMGQRMAMFVRGEDTRRVTPNQPTKSISSETTFRQDIADRRELETILWRQSERVAERLKAAGLAGSTVVLKLRRSDFRILTRSRRLPDPTQLAETIYRQAGQLLVKEADGTPYRLLGVGLMGMVPGETADPVDLADPAAPRRADAERAVDKVRQRFGRAAIQKGRGFRSGPPD
ncbi:MAG: DNA polymerase IV [Alphaproteobacteria bacterium]|jgi:DNA polymerase-4|nr:DNA polymerase IV [Alphaproteobacteria bacterium]MDP6566152.1 DNA polymerase IV [Alphaproteobacteria bacterium]MDP6813607.1 DNA polymerase IV [Alphaproteobacteria bacterium]